MNQNISTSIVPSSLPIACVVSNFDTNTPNFSSQEVIPCLLKKKCCEKFKKKGKKRCKSCPHR